ncbi:DNA polymerase III subunit alpha [Salinisphaera sp. Q1T1-3]|uniref:DNA polymerase III subunit alpha n=1 Tax=Salinisphaera sp. Q1T1-3 TaxID=2321229 RepID=UPI000E722092|nr:DNA polymerase III subunit alpha [Salinisphaera sp. Q1T1-3]RJS95328.1 DNA polymerase III subunit alpha [Salinisphaera sp. Q1T1-3]
MSTPFVHLSLHTEYSLSDGIVRIKPLVAAAREAGMPAVGVADTVNLFGMVKFYKAALGAGIKPIVGVDMRIDEGEAPPSRLRLFAQHRDGYRNLCELLTRAYLHGQGRGGVLARREWVIEKADGLIALSGGMNGDTGMALMAGKRALAEQRAREWQSVFGDRYYLEVTRCGRTGEAGWLAETVGLALDADIPIVATNDVRFPSADDFDAHEARVAIHDGYTLADPRRPKTYTAEQYLKTPEQMAELFSDLPEAIENSVAIAKRCNLVLTLGENVLPDFPVPEEHDTDSFLRAESEAGLAERLNNLYPQAEERERHVDEYQHRLDHELDVIRTMGFPGYFLIVADFIRWARENGVPVGPGRGSGAGSLVAYALGITDLDPLAYDLLFERFLNPERVSMPDFDVDFCMDGRDRVIEYVAQAYGQEKVSQIITYGTMAAKAVVRDVGRVLGHPYGFVDRIAKQVPFAPDMTLTRALEESEELRTSREDEEVGYLLDLALSLEGLSRNAGKHAGGVVIAPSNLNDFTPLYCEAGGNNRVTQFDKDDVEAVGLVKFDFLGLRTLTIIENAVRVANARLAAADREQIDVRHIPLDDKASFDLLKAGDTTAVFQLESSGMRRLIKRLQPAEFEDIIALVALYRPGPLESGMVEDFIDRKHGRAKVVYPHPLLSEVLEPTYGVILYQEQVMQIAQVLAGYSLGNADLLRRAMGKKKPEEMAKQRDGFVKGAVEKGIEEDTAAYIFDLVEKFAGYGFNKSHSAAYALVSYQTAWLKAHYPADFMASVLSADMDHTDKIVVMIDECHRLDIEVAPPDVNASEYNFSVVDDTTIRYGLGAIKGLGKGAIEAAITERNDGGTFASLYDFCRRIDTSRINRRAIEAMINAGALDGLGPNRASLAHGVTRALAAADQDRAAANVGQNDMFGLAETPDTAGPPLETLDEWPEDERLRAERDTLGLYLTGHPIKAWEAELADMTNGKIADQVAAMPRPEEGGGRRRERKEAIVAGLVVEVRRMKKGKRIIVVLDDGSARIECPLFEDKAAEYGHLLAADKLVIVEGSLSYDDFSDGFRLNANRVMDIEGARAAYASRILLQLQSEARLDVNALAGCVDRYKAPSGCDVVLRYANDEARAVLTLGETRLALCDDLLSDLRRVVGADAVQVRYRRAQSSVAAHSPNES